MAGDADAAALARRITALNLLIERAAHAERELRVAIAAQWPVTRREPVVLPDTGAVVGAVSLDRGSVLASVVDYAALQEWVEQTLPDSTETTTRIRPATLDALLAQAKRVGAPVTDQGELIPGIEVRETPPRVVVRRDKSPAATAALLDAVVEAANIRSLLAGAAPEIDP